MQQLSFGCNSHHTWSLKASVRSVSVIFVVCGFVAKPTKDKLTKLSDTFIGTSLVLTGYRKQLFKPFITGILNE